MSDTEVLFSLGFVCKQENRDSHPIKKGSAPSVSLSGSEARKQVYVGLLKPCENPSKAGAGGPPLSSAAVL